MLTLTSEKIIKDSHKYIDIHKHVLFLLPFLNAIIAQRKPTSTDKHVLFPLFQYNQDHLLNLTKPSSNLTQWIYIFQFNFNAHNVQYLLLSMFFKVTNVNHCHTTIFFSGIHVITESFGITVPQLSTHPMTHKMILTV